MEDKTVRFRVLCSAAIILPALGMVVEPLGSVQDKPMAWQPRAAMEAPRFEAACVAHQGKLYVLGGFGSGVRATKRCDSYDPKTDTWTRLADMPQALTHVNAVLDGHVIWIAGGFETNGRGPAVANVWKYDIEGDSFEAGPPLPDKRAGGGLARVGRTLHYFGGLLEDRNTDAPEHWTLDLDGGTEWVVAPPMPAPRNQAGIAVAGAKIYVIGGQYHHDRSLGEPEDQPLVDVFDTETGEWSKGPELPMKLSHVEPSAFVHEDDLIVVGGRSVREHSGSVLALSLESDEWRELGQLPSPLLAPVARLIDGNLIVGGGALLGYRVQEAMWSVPLDPGTDGQNANPVAYAKASIDRGRSIYLPFCAECHDRDGRALTSAMANATDLTAPEAWLYGTSDTEVFASIRDGRGDDMPPFGSDIRNEEDIWHIVNFIRSIGPDKDRK